MKSKIDKFINSIPKELRPASNPILNALLSAWAGADDELMAQLKNAKAQLFVKTAEGTYLDRLASNYGVSRPFSLGLLDSDFQNLIPNLSLKQKEITKSFYDTMDVFWGPQFSRANALASVVEPYDLNVGNYFSFRVDGGSIQKTGILPGDVRTPGEVTAAEIVRIINRCSGVMAEVIADQASDANTLNIRTNTPGARGSIEFLSGFGALGISQNIKFRITDQAQRTVLYQIKPGEILIELPAIVPTLRRTLKGSHHFHEDHSLESAVAPENGIWQGSFVYSSSENPFVVTSGKAALSRDVLKGDVLNEISVDDASKISASGGNLIFNFGKTNQEYPVKFISVPNKNTVLIDPGYSFQNTHTAGSSINFLVPNQSVAFKPRLDGSDLAIYLTSPANARDVVQGIISNLSAAGIIVTFLILLPTYTYLIENPFSS